MKEALLFLSKHDQYFIAGIILLFGIVEIVGGLLSTTKRSKGDFIQELLSFSILSVLIKPGIIILVAFLGQQFFPSAASFLNGANMFLVFFVYILVDDFLQYWYHRSAHEYEFMWKLHRPHHAANEMGLLVSYRNAALYYLLMPNIWWIALVTFLGGGIPVAIGLILKQLVIISSHSTTKWDQILYRYPVLSPVAFVIEHIIVTPAFHFAHHGKSMADDVSDPNGNYGNMFSIWDQLFGSALFTRKYPTDLGLQQEVEDTWYEHMFFPIVKSKDHRSDIAKGSKKEITARNEPVTLELEAGNHLWCSCGFSKTQPFCDGSHHGTKFKPKLLKVEKTKSYYLCNCKQSKLGPICDGSHKGITS